MRAQGWVWILAAMAVLAAVALCRVRTAQGEAAPAPAPAATGTRAGLEAELAARCDALAAQVKTFSNRLAEAAMRLENEKTANEPLRQQIEKFKGIEIEVREQERKKREEIQQESIQALSMAREEFEALHATHQKALWEIAVLKAQLNALTNRVTVEAVVTNSGESVSANPGTVP